MPQLRGLTVSVLQAQGVALEEWGQDATEKVATCYIVAEANVAFAITITPELPFGNGVGERIKALRRDDDEHYGVRRKQDRAPWHLLATVRLDGRQLREKRAIIYLDDESAFFNEKTGGAVTMRGRIMHDANGVISAHDMVFVDVDLGLSFSELGLDGHTGGPEEVEQVIEVAFERIILNKTTFHQKRVEVPDFTQHEPSGRRGKDTTHTVIRQAAEEVGTVAEHIGYHSLDGEGMRFATFKFLYRSEEALKKMNFPGFDLQNMPNDMERLSILGQPVVQPDPEGDDHLDIDGEHEQSFSDLEYEEEDALQRRLETEDRQRGWSR